MASSGYLWSVQQSGGAHLKQPEAISHAVAPGEWEGQVLGMEELDGLLVELHVLAE